MDAIAYLRKSSAPSKHTRTVSFEIQEEEVRALASRNGDTLTKIMSDWGRSGGSTKRPDYQDLLAKVDAGEVSVIYSFSLSRLSRSLIDFADLLERCKRHGVKIRLVQEGEIDWSSATGRAFANMAMVFAQFERELASERNTAAVAERRSRGDHLGQAPYGWTVVGGKLVRRRDEDPERIVAAFREAASFAGAATLLNEWGVPTRRQGTKWNHSVVSDILRQQGPADLKVAITRKRPKAAALAGAYFAGLLRCPCGGTLTPRKDDGAPSGVSGYYCSRAYRERHPKMHVSERVILEWAKDEAGHLRVPYDQVALAKKADRELERVERRRTMVLDTYFEEKMSKADRDARLSALDKERDRLLARSTTAIIPAVPWNKTPQVVNGVLRALWDHIELDVQLRPVGADWLVKEWRA